MLSLNFLSFKELQNGKFQHLLTFITGACFIGANCKTFKLFPRVCQLNKNHLFQYTTKTTWHSKKSTPAQILA